MQNWYGCCWKLTAILSYLEKLSAGFQAFSDNPSEFQNRFVNFEDEI